ncbi:hypothetical protein SCHPADRAFT_910137 [Schizopora paradoxa]|uniref:Uncharacterized protein n=1 Tax=Schizopora paradoxa TaxID=27342 RepID=A0A0H2R5Q8_9AGAM|nr:hypothetical protein SCHPADRAFT_910137 [Schizopora paradoxa]
MGMSKANIPPELLDRIFGHCERYRRIPKFVPNSRLQPLLLVCKNWHGVAERRLYFSVSLGNDRTVKGRNGEKREIKGKDICRKFCETVKSNERVASLVRELRLGCQDIQPEESELHIRIIRNCKNVERVDIQGCDFSQLDDLKAALAERNLVSLSLSGASLRLLTSQDHNEGRPMLALPEVLNLLPNWPRLELFTMVMCDPRRDNIYQQLESPSDLNKNACPALRRISVLESNFFSTHLRFLAHIAPNLEDIAIFIGIDCGPVFKECLEVWSPSIKNLQIDMYEFLDPCPVPVGFLPPISLPMVELCELRSLDTSAPLFTVNALIRLLNLEDLRFTRGTYALCMELARLIEKGKMPCLQGVEMRGFEYEVHGPSAEEREEAKQRELEVGREFRRVCKPRNIFFRDYSTPIKEIEEHYGYHRHDDIHSEASDNDW